jgi:hypothetical protein
MQSVTFQEIGALENIIREVLLNEWEEQGHSMTGKVVRDLEFKIEQTPDTLTLLGLMYPYANIIAAGVKASKIPFRGSKPRGQGTGGVSLFIEALKDYVRNRMEEPDDRKVTSIAFAIAQTQRKEGMPTRGSYKYSSTGKRTEWVGESLEKNEDKLVESIAEWSKDRLLASMDVIIDKWQIALNENN